MQQVAHLFLYKKFYGNIYNNNGNIALNESNIVGEKRVECANKEYKNRRVILTVIQSNMWFKRFKVNVICISLKKQGECCCSNKSNR